MVDSVTHTRALTEWMKSIFGSNPSSTRSIQTHDVFRNDKLFTVMGHIAFSQMAAYNKAS